MPFARRAATRSRTSGSDPATGGKLGAPNRCRAWETITPAQNVRAKATKRTMHLDMGRLLGLRRPMVAYARRFRKEFPPQPPRVLEKVIPRVPRLALPPRPTTA